jgi:hypothetical protein
MAKVCKPFTMAKIKYFELRNVIRSRRPMGSKVHGLVTPLV